MDEIIISVLSSAEKGFFFRLICLNCQCQRTNFLSSTTQTAQRQDDLNEMAETVQLKVRS